MGLSRDLQQRGPRDRRDLVLGQPAMSGHLTNSLSEVAEGDVKAQSPLGIAAPAQTRLAWLVPHAYLPVKIAERHQKQTMDGAQLAQEADVTAPAAS